jgi:divalent metal cation (Fe/Co/Zn/Cd) transporter
VAAEPSPAPGTIAPARAALVRRGRWLAWFTIGWNGLEGLVAIATGLAAGSIALLARAKRRVGRQLHSQALQADATETTLCVWLSAILLAGLGLNALFGWWWADPLAAFGVVHIAAREGVENWRAEHIDDCC